MQLWWSEWPWLPPSLWCIHTCAKLLPHCIWIGCNNRLKVDRGAAGAEAKLLLASKMIDSSNNFHFYLRICQSNCLCNCAHKCIICNVEDHQCECLPVVKEERLKSGSYRHNVLVLCTLLKKQFKPGLTATLINYNCLPEHHMSCAIRKKHTINTLAGCVSPQCNLCHARTHAPELAIIHAIEQSKDLVFDENTNTMYLTSRAISSDLSSPRQQSPLGQWVELETL